jgi:hypothetical protein
LERKPILLTLNSSAHNNTIIYLFYFILECVIHIMNLIDRQNCFQGFIGTEKIIHKIQLFSTILINMFHFSFFVFIFHRIK